MNVLSVNSRTDRLTLKHLHLHATLRELSRWKKDLRLYVDETFVRKSNAPQYLSKHTNKKIITVIIDYNDPPIDNVIKTCMHACIVYRYNLRCI